MNPEKSSMKIIWAVDPFVEDKSLQRTAAWALRFLTKNMKAEIEPVYSIGAYPATDDVQELAQDELATLLRRVKIAGLKPVRILSESGNRLPEKADQLIAYARKSQAQLIVASTRARKGLSRWMTGSFAESLMLRSDIPLFVVNPNWDHPTELKHIIFPTDFSEESKEALDQVVRFAREIGARITLHHKISYDLNPDTVVVLSPYPAFFPIDPAVIEEEARLRRAQAEAWAEPIRATGVQVEVFVDGRAVGTPVDSILKFSRRNPGLIAMAARSGAFGAVLLGSTTRQVVRASFFPVWIVHVSKKRLKKRVPPEMKDLGQVFS